MRKKHLIKDSKKLLMMCKDSNLKSQKADMVEFCKFSANKTVNTLKLKKDYIDTTKECPNRH